MIPARRSALFTRWFAHVAAGRLRRQFGALRLAGLDEIAAPLARGPVLVVSNHPAWWDPLLLLEVCVRALGADAYAMMDARNLGRLPFFGLVGAFGVDLDDARDGARAVRYAARLLDRPGRLVWIFAQGRERPVTARPLGFRAGSAAVARLAPSAVVVPAALRYEFGGAPDPTAWVACGRALARGDAASLAAQEAAVAAELDRIEGAVGDGGGAEFATRWQRRPSGLSALAERTLAAFTRRRALGPAAPPRA